MKLTDFLQAIANGQFDGQEDAIYGAIKARHQMKSQLTAMSLIIGQRVKIDKIRPKALCGLTGKVIALPRSGNSKRFDVELDKAPVGFGRFGQPFTKIQRGIPASCLFPLE